MSRLLPPSFHIDQYDACLPFITHAELSLGTQLAACCQFDSKAFTPQLVEELGFFLPDALRHAVRKRQAEYVASRWLVAKLLNTLNIAPFQLLNRSDRSPIWPAGLAGSLSHHSDKAFVMLAKAPAWVGNDIERLLSEAQAKELQSMVMTADELALLTKAGFSLSQATTLIFSIKEAVYKAVYPTVQRLFGFEQVNLQAIDTDRHLATVALSDTARPKQDRRENWTIHYWLTEHEVMSWKVISKL